MHTTLPMSHQTSEGGDTPDDSQSQAQRNANLARIRDNQRRSRARRKEYLQELETKYRQCEQMGVEASAELQVAARRVVEENKRLRQLLKRQGMTDGEIDRMVVDVADHSQYSPAASSLEGMIGARKTCRTANGGNATPATLSPMHVTDVRSSNVHHASQGQTSAQQRHSGLLSPSMATSSQWASPHSSVSSGVRTPSSMQFPASSANNFALPAAESHPGSLYSDMHHDNTFGWQTHNQEIEATEAGSSSCYAAADAIRSIKPDVGYELEEELGCSNGNDCSVPNPRIFSIMDRYTEGSL